MCNIYRFQLSRFKLGILKISPKYTNHPLQQWTDIICVYWTYILVFEKYNTGQSWMPETISSSFNGTLKLLSSWIALRLNADRTGVSPLLQFQCQLINLVAICASGKSIHDSKSIHESLVQIRLISAAALHGFKGFVQWLHIHFSHNISNHGNAMRRVLMDSTSQNENN